MPLCHTGLKNVTGVESNYVALEAGLDEGESIRCSEHSRRVAWC